MSDGIERALLRRDPASDRFLLFSHPLRGLVARGAAEVPRLLAEVESAAAGGAWAVGYVGYEAAPAFDAALSSHPPGGGPPLAAFSIFAAPSEIGLPRPRRPARLARIAPDLAAAEHAAAVATIRAAIARGETYQVNFTFPFRAALAGDPEDLFAALLAPGEAPYAAYLAGERWAIASLSPELFFARGAGRIVMRPMKGTRPRGRFAAEDAELAAELAAAAKDRAENLMIVDMVRNDLARIAAPGSVRVEAPFAIERYPTVWQMTSTVAAESFASLPELFAALFPCASVTGAPKAATMEWIRRLEQRPRGVYCGAIGHVAPGGVARFAVAIRTLAIDRATARAVYGVGSGIVWESDAASEYRECLAKAAVLASPPAADFELFETLRVRPPRAPRRLARHLARLAGSAAYWGFPFDEELVRARLATALGGRARSDHRLRIRLSSDGAVAVDLDPVEPGPRVWTFALAGRPVDSGDRFLFHKTTRRGVYESAWAEAPVGVDEVLLTNERGELTEGTRSNVVLELDGRLVTPPVGAGMLAGVGRAGLLAAGRIEEATLVPDDLSRARRIWFVSSLRGLHPARRRGEPLESPA